MVSEPSWEFLLTSIERPRRFSVVPKSNQVSPKALKKGGGGCRSEPSPENQCPKIPRDACAAVHFRTTVSNLRPEASPVLLPSQRNRRTYPSLRIVPPGPHRFA